MSAPAALDGVKVVEGPGRFAVAVCASLLAQLGAEIVRADRPQACGALAADADVLVAEPAAMVAQSERAPVQCAISATGALPHPHIASDAPEIVLQAQGGLMATTGLADGRPESVLHPVLEIFAAVDAAVSILAALRVKEAGGPAQLIDAAVWDTNASSARHIRLTGDRWESVGLSRRCTAPYLRAVERLCCARRFRDDLHEHRRTMAAVVADHAAR